MNNELLKKLTDASGISGYEGGIRETILSELDRDYYEIKIDRVGNLYVKNPGRKPNKKILLDAHMDDLGVIVTDIKSDGALGFYPIGGSLELTLLGKAVLLGEKRIKGIFCCNAEIKKQPLTYKDMYIDIGCETKQETAELVEVGDHGDFESNYLTFGNESVKARNFDDRAGCSILLEILKEKLDIEFTAVFAVREEVGLLGAKAAAYTETPDIAINLEGGGCSDIPFVPEDEKVCAFGGGALLSVRNQFSIFDSKLLKRVYSIADKCGIPYQTRRGNVGGCDGAAYQMIGTGAEIVTIAVCTRYIHTHNTVITRTDYDATKNLAVALLKEFAKDE